MVHETEAKSVDAFQQHAVNLPDLAGNVQHHHDLNAALNQGGAHLQDLKFSSQAIEQQRATVEELLAATKTKFA